MTVHSAILSVAVLVCLLGAAIGCSSGGSNNESGSGGAGSGGTSSTCASDNGCEACVTCALSGPCKSGADACSNSGDCTALSACITEIDDPAVIADCKADHPTGASEYCAYVECAVYQQCGGVCEPAQVCPP